jgi:macrolide transport system ATP-binding/permease protein
VDQYDTDTPLEVVGVIRDIREGPLNANARAAVYIPFQQNAISDFYVTVRTVQPEETVLHSMTAGARQLDTDLIVEGEETMSDRISDSQAAYLHRSAASLVAAFAGLALLLGTVGLYGVISYSGGQRTREIGMRIAFGGAAGKHLFVMGEATWLAALGRDDRNRLLLSCFVTAS